MKEMIFDDPPLVGDPHFEKRKLSAQLQFRFNSLGVKVPSTLAILKKNSATMKDLWEFCFDNQSEMEIMSTVK